VAAVWANSSSWVAISSVRWRLTRFFRRALSSCRRAGSSDAGGLVHEQDRWIGRQGTGNRHALGLAARQLSRQRASPMLDAEAFHQFHRATFRFWLPDTVHVNGRQPHILHRRHVFEEAMKLEDHADLAAQVPNRPGQRGPAPPRDAVDRDSRRGRRSPARRSHEATSSFRTRTRPSARRFRRDRR
jgi:hypothetical protein